MADHIHTIPVLDALRKPNACAFCVMYEKLESDALDFMTGPAYMEDDVRLATNKIGFCKQHLSAMHARQNALGLGLMLHTYMQQLNKDIAAVTKARIPAGFFSKDKSGTIGKLKSHLQKTHESCYVCDKIENTFARYIDTFLHIWKQGGEDAKLIHEQKGFCMPHFIQLLGAAEKLGGGKREKFLDEFLPKQENFFREMEADLEWFTLKFDHRNADEPWKNSRDALPRAIALLGGDA